MSERDRISELPECLITQILSYLPVKDSVKTSALATSWKNHWLHVPVLDLNYHKDFSSQEGLFIGYIDRFLTEGTLQKFKVKSRWVVKEKFMDQIGTVINRGTQHLDLNCRSYRDYGLYYNEFMPLNLYTCKTLVSLKLSRFALSDPCCVVNLPCLKVIHLRKIKWVPPMTLEKFILGCLVLEELTLGRDHYNGEPLVNVCVRSRSLKRLCVLFKARYFTRRTIEKSTYEIHAPELEYMSLKKDNTDRIVVKNLTSLLSIDLDIIYGLVFNPEDVSKRHEIHDFLTGITSVRHMIISQQTLKALDRYSKVGPIPKFNNLSRLQAVSSFQYLPVLLECCPNLKHLIWGIVYTEETKEAFHVINVPQCFVSTLECIEIQGFHDWKEEELNIATYFLENSAVLKKVILRFVHVRGVTDSEIYEELNNLTKSSPGCQILIEYVKS